MNFSNSAVLRAWTSKGGYNPKEGLHEDLSIQSPRAHDNKIEDSSGECTTHRTRIADQLVDLCVAVGIKRAFGIYGRGILPFVEALTKSSLEVFHCRHESGAAFAAAEAYFSSSHPSLVFTTSGPGLINALNGITAAKWEGAKVLIVSPATSHARRGRWAFQETSMYSFPSADLFSNCEIFDFAAIINSPEELQMIASKMVHGFSRPGSFIAHLSLSMSLQRTVMEERIVIPGAMNPGPCCPPDLIDQAATLFKETKNILWVGFGARGSSAKLRELAEQLRMPVMSTPRAKGVFPENHPLYLGVTGLGGHGHVPGFVEKYGADHVIVLGSRLGEYTSFWDKRYEPKRGFVHVDIDPHVFGAAYPHVNTIGIQSEISVFLHALLPRLGNTEPHFSQVFSVSLKKTAQKKTSPQKGEIRIEYLMGAIQRHIIDGSDALVLADVGSSFVWSNHSLSFDEPNRYRTSVGFGSMGFASTGVVGAALACGRRAVAIVGDGAMLMNNEISTAVRYGARAVWIVLNDRRYGMVYHGMRLNSLDYTETEIPRVDFAAFARSVGAVGVRVEKEVEVDAALEECMRRTEPVVVDVLIDPETPPPTLSNIESPLGKTAATPTRKEKS